MNKRTDYVKIDALAEQYRRATDKAAFLDQVWGDLTGQEGTALLAAVESTDGDSYQKIADADDHASSTTLTRFEVSDPLCGAVECFPDQSRAFDRASSHQAAHAVKNDPDPVTVFDRMAHIGDTCLWGSDGRGIEKRTR
mgnify:FL=1